MSDLDTILNPCYKTKNPLELVQSYLNEAALTSYEVYLRDEMFVYKDVDAFKGLYKKNS